MSPRDAADRTATDLRALVQRFVTQGRVEAIFVRPTRHGAVVACHEARAEPGRGLLGDHRARTPRTGDQARKREVTLVQAEHLDAVARFCAIPSVDASRLRRNLVVSGINLLSMRSPFADVVLEWSIGDEVRIEITGPCDPCSRMEQELGPGAYNALRGHGGVTARLMAGGDVRVGDAVRFVAAHRTERARG